MGNDKYKLSKDDLNEAFQKQLRTLNRLSELYDEGEKFLYLEIATKLRVFLHQTKNSTSLFTHIKGYKIPFLSTSSKYNKSNLLGIHLGLVVSKFESFSKEFKRTLVTYEPKFKSSIKQEYLGFEEWWENEVILSDINHNSFTRRDLILNIANKDGGAHVDNSLDENYYNASRKNSASIISTEFGDNTEFATNPIPPTIRQIAFELNHSIEKWLRV